MWEGAEGRGRSCPERSCGRKESAYLGVGIQSSAACLANFEVLADFTGSLALKVSVCVQMEVAMEVLVNAAIVSLAVLGARKGEWIRLERRS